MLWCTELDTAENFGLTSIQKPLIAKVSAIKYSPCIFKFRFQMQTDLLTYILYDAGKLVTNFISVDFRYLCRSIIFCLLYLCTFQAACSWHVHHKRIHRTRNNRLLTRHHTETRASVLQIPFEILKKCFH